MVFSMDNVRWIWVFLALLFFFAEIFVPGRLFFSLGVGAIAGGVAAFLGVEPIWQLALFAGVALIIFLMFRLATRRNSTPHESVYGIDRVIGKEAIVVVAIDPKTAQGRVRVEREQWPADSESGQPIADGTTVQVLAMRSERVLVRPLPRE